MKLFITGATGYIGHHVALQAAARGYQVQALVRNLQSPNVPKAPNIQCFQGDVTDYDSVARAMAGCQYVLHAAAMAQFWHKDLSVFYGINVKGTRHVLEAAWQQGIIRLVFTSSCAVLGPSAAQPVSESDARQTPFENDYEIAKFCAEEVLKDYVGRGLPAVIVAPPRVYGPGLDTAANPITKLIKNTLRRGVAFIPAAGHTLGNYAYIDDVVAGHFAALEKGRPGEKYILGGENVSYRRLFETIGQAAGTRLPIVPVPVALLKTWAALTLLACRVVGRQTHLSPKVMTRLVQNRELSCDKAVQELGYQVTPFSEGIEKTVRWLHTK